MSESLGNEGSEPNPFERSEPPSSCLSGMRVSLAALDEFGPEVRDQVQAHLASCARCAARVAAEREAVARAADEPLPTFVRPASDVVSLAGRRATASLRANVEMRSRRNRWLATGAVFALAALVFLVTRPVDVTRPLGEGDGTRAKGAPTVEVAVQRDGVLLGDPVAIAAAPPLATNDKLRLHVGRGGGIHIALEGFDAGGWVDLFRGVIPEDGWLPTGLTVTPGDPARLRLLVCAAPIPTSDLASAPIALDTLRDRVGCNYLEHTFEAR